MSLTLLLVLGFFSQKEHLHNTTDLCLAPSVTHYQKVSRQDLPPLVALTICAYLDEPQKNLPLAWSGQANLARFTCRNSPLLASLYQGEGTLFSMSPPCVFKTSLPQATYIQGVQRLHHSDIRSPVMPLMGLLLYHATEEEKDIESLCQKIIQGASKHSGPLPDGIHALRQLQAPLRDRMRTPMGLPCNPSLLGALQYVPHPKNYPSMTPPSPS